MTQEEMKEYFTKKFSQATYEYDEFDEDIKEPKQEKYRIDKDTRMKLIGEGYTEHEIRECEKKTQELFDTMEVNNAISKKEKSTSEFDFSTIVWDELPEYDMYEMKKSLNLNSEERKIFENIWYLKNMFYNSGKPIPNDTKYFTLKALRGEIELAEKFKFFHSDINPTLLKEAKDIVNDESILSTIDLDYIDKKNKAANKAKNASKTIKIKSTMPQKKLDKYNLEPGNMFESQQALAEYCGVTKQMVVKWKKCNYIEEVETRPLSVAEIKAILEK